MSGDPIGGGGTGSLEWSTSHSPQAVHQLPIPAAEVAWAVVYGLGYAALLLFAASFLFARRDFR